MNNFPLPSNALMPSFSWESFSAIRNFSKNKIVMIAIGLIALLGAAYLLVHLALHNKSSSLGKKTKSSSLKKDDETKDLRAKDLPSKLFTKGLQSLKKGYAIVPLLDPGASESLFEASKNFDVQPESYKEQFIVKNRVEIGYSSLKKKKVFVVRDTQIPDELKTFIPYIQKVHEISLNILKFIESDLNMKEGQLTEAVSDTSLSSDRESTSLLRLFAYDPSDEVGIAADAHEDLGLLTIILRSPVPSLEVIDYEDNFQWKNLEKLADETEAVVLVGRTLEQVSGGRYPAASHRVANSVDKRFSIVYQLRAEPEAKISTSSRVMTVDEWLKDLKRGLTSINGSY